jgi:TRAP transporter TAXI family solute receptor
MEGDIMIKKTDRKMVFILVILLSGFFLFSQANAFDKTMKLSALCGPVGGSGFGFMSVWAPVINSELDLNISVQSRGGNAMTARLVDNGSGHFGLTTAGLAYQGRVGKADWANHEKLTNMRGVAIFQRYVFQAYGLAKTGINKFEDLNGKVVSYNRKGTSTQTYLSQWGDILGLKPSKIYHLGPGQGNQMISDGRLDAQFTTGAVPHNATLELQANHKIFVISFGKELSEKIVAEHPEVSPYTIKAGTYKSLDHDVYTVADGLMLIAHKDLPADLVYSVVKTTFEKKKELVQGFAPFKRAEVENIVQSTIPLHPGAVKFYKEKGLSLPDKLLPQ